MTSLPSAASLGNSVAPTDQVVHSDASAATLVHSVASTAPLVPPIADDCTSLGSGATQAAFLYSVESIMDLSQLHSRLDVDDDPVAGPSFPSDVLNATVEDSDDDDAWSDDESTSSLPCGEVCMTDVVLPCTADQHLRIFPNPTDAVTTAIDLAQMMSTNDVPPDLPVNPLYALQHQCTTSKRRALRIYGECERLIHQINPNGIDAPRAHFDGGASVSTTNRMELLWSCRPLTRKAPRLRVADGENFTPSHEGYLSVTRAICLCLTVLDHISLFTASTLLVSRPLSFPHFARAMPLAVAASPAM